MKYIAVILLVAFGTACDRGGSGPPAELDPTVWEPGAEGTGAATAPAPEPESDLTPDSASAPTPAPQPDLAPAPTSEPVSAPEPQAAAQPTTEPTTDPAVAPTGSLLPAIPDGEGEGELRNLASELNSNGFEQYRAGELELAAQLYRRAAEADPSYHQARYNFACVWNLLGNEAEARQVLAEFLDNGCARCLARVMQARRDADWESQWGDPEFERLTTSFDLAELLRGVGQGELGLRRLVDNSRGLLFIEYTEEGPSGLPEDTAVEASRHLCGRRMRPVFEVFRGDLAYALEDGEEYLDPSCSGVRCSVSGVMEYDPMEVYLFNENRSALWAVMSLTDVLVGEEYIEIRDDFVAGALARHADASCR